MKKTLIPLLLCISLQLIAQTYLPTWESLDSRPVPQWYKDVKFGIFIHWGVYSVPAYSTKGSYAEWYQNGLNSGDSTRIKYQKEKFGDRTYYDLAKDFKAELYQPDEWAKVIEASGAKYVVLTSKHHDGFALWPSKEASKTWGFPWNSAEVGPHRDLLGDLFTAIRKTSVHAGMYYSLYEWYNPLWLSDRKKYVAEHEWPQIKDLITTYKPEVFWTDGDWDATDETWKSKELLAWMYNESPVKNKIVTYDRWGSGLRFHHGGVYTPEYQPGADFEDHYWEESRGMGFSYGYNREEDAWDYNSSQSLVFQLIDKVSRGGNFLLDIGPDEHGKIPPIMQERLLQIGEWMKINGEAIYNTQRWKEAAQWGNGRQDYQPKHGDGDLLLKLTVDPDPGFAVKQCFFTYNGTTNNLYALLPKWPSDKSFTIKNLVLDAHTKIEFLETHETLEWQQMGDDISIKLPNFDPNKIKSNYAFVIKINNTGAFAAKPKVTINYPAHALKSLINITAVNETHYTLDGSEPTINSPIYTKPFSINTNATLMVRSFKQGILSSNSITIPLKSFTWQAAKKEKNLNSGLQLKAFEIKTNTVEDFNHSTPVKTSIATSISAKQLTRKENAGLVYEGYLNIPVDGIYSFYLSSDDGSKCWIDNETTIDRDGPFSNDDKTGKAALKKGFHPFKLAYFNTAGGADLTLKYSVGDEEKKDIPSSWFYYKK